MKKNELLNKIANLLTEYEIERGNKEILGCFIFNAEFDFLFEYNGEKMCEIKDKTVELQDKEKEVKDNDINDNRLPRTKECDYCIWSFWDGEDLYMCKNEKGGFEMNMDKTVEECHCKK